MLLSIIIILMIIIVVVLLIKIRKLKEYQLIIREFNRDVLKAFIKVFE